MDFPGDRRLSGGPGQLILATVAATIAFVVSGGNPLAAAAAFSIGMTVGGIIWPMDGGTQYGPRLSDREVQTSAYGTPIPHVWGSYRLSGNIIWARDIEERADFKRVGKSLFSSGTKVWSYTYFGHFAIAVCKGPVGAVGRIWADNKLIYDPDSEATGKYDRYIRIYLGGEDQLPDPDIQADQGIDNTPAFRGICYIVFDGLPLLNFGNRIPTISVEIGAAGKAAEWLDGSVSNLGSANWSYTPAQPSLVVNTWSEYVTVINADTLEATQFVPVDYRQRWIDGGNLEGPQAEPPEGYEDPILYALEAVHGTRAPSITSTDYTRAQIDPASGDVIVFLQGSTYRSAVCRFRINSGSQWMPDGSVTLVWVRGFVTDTGVGRNWLFGDKIYMMDQWVTVHYCIDIATGTETWRQSFRPPLDLSHNGTANSATCRISDRSVYFTWSNGAFFGGANGVARVDLDTGDLLASVTALSISNDDMSALYDTVTDSVIIAHDGGFIRLDADTLAITETVTTTTPWTVYGSMFDNAGTNNAVSGSFRVTSGGIDATPSFWQISTATGFPILWTDTVDAAVKTDGGAFSGEIPLVSSRPKFFSYSGGTQTYKFGNDGGTSTTLGAIIADIAESCEMASTDIDVSALVSKIVPGYGVLRESTGRAAIEPLCSAYGVDAPERDAKLVFQWRKTAADAVVDEDDLGAVADGSEQIRVTENRRQEIELPSAVTVTYAARARDYQTATQSAKRWDDTIEAGDPRSVEFPLVLDDTDAQTLAHRLMFLAWIERTSFSFSLPPRWMIYDPGDVIDLPIGDESVRALITKLEVGGDGIVKVFAISTDAIAAEPPPQAPVVPIFLHQTLSTIQLMTLAVIDAPLLSDDDDLAGIYVGAQGQNASWTGGAAYASLAGADYEFAASFTGTTPIGVAGPLAYHRSALIDRTNTLRVVFNADVVLSSVTELEMLAGANRLMIGSELLSFATATQVASGVYDLSVLLRGQQGTEWASGHASSSRAIVVDDLISVDLAASSIGTSTSWKGVSEGEFLDEVTAIAVTPAAVRIKPLSPVHIRGERDESGDLTITWVRRARVNADWEDGYETALDETVEAYEIDVLSDDIVLRTLSSGTPEASYDASMQTTDFGAPQSALSVAVYQLSTRVGRGYPGTASI
jgi:hypothetical protein